VKSKEITEANPWWKWGKGFPEFDSDLKKLKKKLIIFKRKRISLKTGNIYVVRGPRQVGKTVWLKQTIEDLIIKEKVDPKVIFYLSCDKLTGKTRKELRETINFYLENVALEKRPVYLFLDEITWVKDWVYELKSLADEGILERISVLVSGSNPWKMKEKAELLPGRRIEGNQKIFSPISFREFIFQLKEPSSFLKSLPNELRKGIGKLFEKMGKICVRLGEIEKIVEFTRIFLNYQKELQFLFLIYLKCGGFPDAINSYFHNRCKGEEKIDDEIYEKFTAVVRGDLASLIRGDYAIRGLLKSIIEKMGSKYSFNTISREIPEHPDHKTIASHLELLKDSFLIRIFHSYDFSKREYRLKADKKIFFYDPFLYYSMKSWLEGRAGYEICSETVLDDDILGKIIEGIVGHHIALTEERLPMREMITFLWFYYDRTREIDFLYKDKKRKFVGIEVKYQNSVTLQDLNFINQVKHYFLLSKDVVKIGEINIIPVSMFLSFLEKSEGVI